MSEWIRRQLAELIAQDPSIGGDARRCEALLRDLCRNQHKKEVAALATAVREGVVAEIRTGSAAAPAGAQFDRLVRRLHDDCGLREDVSRWAIEAWCDAYKIPLRGPQPAAVPADSMTTNHAGAPYDSEPRTCDATFSWELERSRRQEEALREELERRKRAEGTRVHSYVLALCDLASFLSNQGRYSEACDLLETARKICRSPPALSPPVIEQVEASLSSVRNRMAASPDAALLTRR